MSSATVKSTSSPAIANAPVVGLLEGNGSFSNYQLAAIVLGVPWVVKRSLPFVSRGGLKTYLFLVILLGAPLTVGYWALMSRYGSRKNEKVVLPGKNIEEYITINDAELKAQYNGKSKIPMQIFYDAYFNGQIDIKGDVLEILEQRHDFTKMTMTFELFKYVFTDLIPDVILHSAAQDKDQIQTNYDRGNDFYEWFLGPRMIYTSGVISDINRKETLEELQDNKLAIVCQKLELKETDRLLDIGCGWGTLTAYAAKNYGCDVTGVTLAKEQTHFGNDRIKKNGVTSDKARVLNLDARDAPGGPGYYTKIVSLEMAEHVGIRRYGEFLRQVCDMLDDDGIFVFQVSGIRPTWQYEDLIWGLFMNKYVFPGADASLSVGWVTTQLESAGFTIKSVDGFGVHYSATLHRWYENWLSNEEKILATYGERWFRVWSFFLAWSTIASRQGSADVFQWTLHKNLNAYHRVNGVPTHAGLKNTSPGNESIIP